MLELWEVEDRKRVEQPGDDMLAALARNPGLTVAGAETREHLRATADEAFRLTLFDLVGVAAILGTGRNIERIGQADIETTGEIKIDRGLLVPQRAGKELGRDRKSTRLNSRH